MSFRVMFDYDSELRMVTIVRAGVVWTPGNPLAHNVAAPATIADRVRPPAKMVPGAGPPQ